MVGAAPGFIIHAAGSLGNRPDLGKRPYRLKCRFDIGAHPSARHLELAKYEAMDQWVADMAVRGYDYIGDSSRLPKSERGVRMTFKGAHIEIRGIPKPKRPPSSREMEYAVRQGAKFRAEDDLSSVWTVPHYTETELWDYELSAVFLSNIILMEVPDLHEEKRPR